MQGSFHKNVVGLSESVSVDRDGTLRTELVVTTSIPMEASASNYDEAQANEVIEKTVEYLKQNDHFDAAVFFLTSQSRSSSREPRKGLGGVADTRK